jgi:hypothetical protein
MLLFPRLRREFHASEPIPLQGRAVPWECAAKVEGREKEGRGHALGDFKSQISNGRSEI